MCREASSNQVNQVAEPAGSHISTMEFSVHVCVISFATTTTVHMLVDLTDAKCTPTHVQTHPCMHAHSSSVKSVGQINRGPVRQNVGWGRCESHFKEPRCSPDFLVNCGLIIVCTRHVL